MMAAPQRWADKRVRHRRREDTSAEALCRFGGDQNLGVHLAAVAAERPRVRWRHAPA